MPSTEPSKTAIPTETPNPEKPTAPPTSTPQPNPTVTPKAIYATNNPAKWLVSLNEEGYLLEDSGTRNNLEASREHDRVHQAKVFELFESTGRITSAFEEYSVNCNELSALVAVSQEVMTFPTKRDAETVFNYFYNKPEELANIGVYLYDNPEISYKNGEAPGDQNFLISTSRYYNHCGEGLDLYQAISFFQRENVIGIVIAVGRDDANTRIPTFFYAIDLDLNVLANP